MYSQSLEVHPLSIQYRKDLHEELAHRQIDIINC